MVTYAVMKNYVTGNWELIFINLILVLCAIYVLVPTCTLQNGIKISNEHEQCFQL